MKKRLPPSYISFHLLLVDFFLPARVEYEYTAKLNYFYIFFESENWNNFTQPHNVFDSSEREGAKETRAIEDIDVGGKVMKAIESRVFFSMNNFYII